MNIRKAASKGLLGLYQRRKRQAADVTLTHCLDVARQMVGRCQFAFFISRAGNNGNATWPSARLVEPILDSDEFVFWIGTRPGLRKVVEVAAHPAVTLAFGHEGDAANLVVYGMASVVDDRKLKKKYWKNAWSLFFPNGPDSDDYVLLRVEALRMELMDFKHNIIAEPFGLNPVALQKSQRRWTVDAG